MGDEHHRLVLGGLIELLVQAVFAQRVHGRGGFVQDQDPRLAHKRPGDRQVLPLAAGEVHAFVEGFAKDGLVAVRQATDDIVRAGLPRRRLHQRALADGFHAPDAHVVRGREVVAEEILKDHADVAAVIRKVVVAQVLAVEQHAALVRIVEAREQFHDGGLAGAVLAHQGDLLAGRDAKGNVLENPLSRLPPAAGLAVSTRRLRGSRSRSRRL